MLLLLGVPEGDAPIESNAVGEPVDAAVPAADSEGDIERVAATVAVPVPLSVGVPVAVVELVFVMVALSLRLIVAVGDWLPVPDAETPCVSVAVPVMV